MKRYRLKRTDRAALQIPEGTEFVYDCRGHDYGCASDDTRNTGVEHTSVTLDKEGGYPFFTIPVDDLEVVQ